MGTNPSFDSINLYWSSVNVLALAVTDGSATAVLLFFFLSFSLRVPGPVLFLFSFSISASTPPWRKWKGPIKGAEVSDAPLSRATSSAAIGRRVSLLRCRCQRSRNFCLKKNKQHTHKFRSDSDWSLRSVGRCVEDVGKPSRYLFDFPPISLRLVRVRVTAVEPSRSIAAVARHRRYLRNGKKRTKKKRKIVKKKRRILFFVADQQQKESAFSVFLLVRWAPGDGSITSTSENRTRWPEPRRKCHPSTKNRS